MNHLHAAMRVIERTTNRDADERAFFGRELSLLVVLAQKLRNADALDELHRQKISAALNAELVDRHDVRMAQRDGRLRFFDEAAHEILVERELVANLLHDQSFFEPARTAQRRQEHAGHAAARQLTFEHVLAEDLGIH
jgi:hypothetical protein